MSETCKRCVITEPVWWRPLEKPSTTTVIELGQEHRVCTDCALWSRAERLLCKEAEYRARAVPSWPNKPVDNRPGIAGWLKDPYPAPEYK